MKNKYYAKKVYVDNIAFASKKEANRYTELKTLQQAGKIQDLQMQVKFEIIPAQYEDIIQYSPKQHKPKVVKKLVERKVDYVADFVYRQGDELVVEDVKGFRDGAAYRIFALKRKLMLQVHGIKVKEI